MDQTRGPARLVPPGRIIGRELEARGWQQKDLAQIMARPEQAISEIINGRKEITPETARELGCAFGTSADFWISLEMSYRLRLAEHDAKEQTIQRRAQMYDKVPYREIIRRGWIEDKDKPEEQEQQVCRFLGISSLDEEPHLAIAARRSAHGKPEQVALIAWARRAEQITAQQQVNTFSLKRLSDTIEQLLRYSVDEECVVQVPNALSQLGIHFVIVPALPKTYLDGAVLYRDTNPIVALTLRYDRIDNFWFTLMHELAHIVAQHPGAYLDRLFDRERDLTAEEQEADEIAKNWLIKPIAYAEFASNTPITDDAIIRFAAQIGRHPSIVAGRIQHETQNYRRHVRLRASVRPHLEAWIDHSSGSRAPLTG